MLYLLHSFSTRSFVVTLSCSILYTSHVYGSFPKLLLCLESTDNFERATSLDFSSFEKKSHRTIENETQRKAKATLKSYAKKKNKKRNKKKQQFIFIARKNSGRKKKFFFIRNANNENNRGGQVTRWFAACNEERSGRYAKFGT